MPLIIYTIRLYKSNTTSWLTLEQETTADRPEYPNWAQDIKDLAETLYRGWELKEIILEGQIIKVLN